MNYSVKKSIAMMSFVLLLAVQSVFAQTTSLEVPSKGYKHFLVVGDWGRNGEFGQQEVANEMAKAATKLEPDFIIATGDNFYPDGVASIDDPLWLSSYEQIYKAHSLYCPWYVVLGNHDYRGNPQAELDYSQKSRRWNLPSRYYSFTKKIDDTTNALFVFMDTSPFQREYWSDLNKYHIGEQDTLAQLRWIDSVLRTSKAQWKFVIGHHHVYSSGKRTINDGFRSTISPILEKYKVNAYINGHEHFLQHHFFSPQETVHYFCSGAGAGSEDYSKMKKSPNLFFSDHAGFMSFSVGSASMIVQAIDSAGAILYKTTIKR
jgi:predicted MPP superfamily phosphohydrolase